MIRGLELIMKALRLLALAIAVFASASLAARADGRPDVVYTPGPPPCTTCDAAYLGYDWGGFYAGGHLGMGFARGEWTIIGPGLLEHNSSGIAGGVQLGWQKQWGNLVTGVEVSFTGLDADITSHTAFLGDEVTRTTQVSNLVSVTGRLGYAQDNLLAYVKAGYASADVDFSLRI